MTKLAGTYENALARMFDSEGYARVTRGLYVRPRKAEVQHGACVTFYRKGARLIVQPFLEIFCPRASKLVDEGLNNVSRSALVSKRLGHPFIAHPLYDLVRTVSKSDRHTFSYDVCDLSEIEDTAHLVLEDFRQVNSDFFQSTLSMRDLHDQILARPWGTGAGMYAMALTYLIDENVTPGRFDEIAMRIAPSPMTKGFATFMKNKLVARVANAGGTCGS